MLKRALMLGAVLIVTSMPSWADGFYTGLGIGRDTADFNVKATALGITATENAAGNGYLGSVFVGYGASFSQFYLGGELGGQLSSLEYSNSLIDSGTDVNKDTLKINRSVSVSILPGYKITDNSMLYGRVGYVRSNLNIRSNTVLLGSNSKNTGIHGIRYGVGAQTNFNQNFGVRLEYNHIAYSTYKLSNTLGTLKIKPSTDQVELDGVVSFG